MAMFVIYGNQSSGKTHTAWLVFDLLRAAGTKEQHQFHPKQKDMCYADVIQDIIKSYPNHNLSEVYDFRAIVEYMGKKVAIFSAGDYVKDENWEITSFVDNMDWAKNENVDHIVCTSRSREVSGSVMAEIATNYKQAVYDWYYKVKTDVLADQINDAKKVAGEVFRDIK